MQFFKPPPLLVTAFREISQKLWPNEGPEGGDDLAIAPDRLVPPAAPYSIVRLWRAAQAEPDQKLVDAIYRSFVTIELRPYVNEATTGDHMIIPILEALGYFPWKSQPFLGDNRPDYQLASTVGLEIKKFSGGPNRSGATDLLSGDAMNSRFRSIADQIVTYLDEIGLATMLYSNGAVWWRVEKDENGDLHAMRYNMRIVYNDMKNGFRPPNHLSYFVNMFHSQAFFVDNNYAIPVHRGLPQFIDPVGQIWLKDLNRGFGTERLTGF